MTLFSCAHTRTYTQTRILYSQWALVATYPNGKVYTTLVIDIFLSHWQGDLCGQLGSWIDQNLMTSWYTVAWYSRCMAVYVLFWPDGFGSVRWKTNSISSICCCGISSFLALNMDLLMLAKESGWCCLVLHSHAQPRIREREREILICIV